MVGAAQDDDRRVHSSRMETARRAANFSASAPPLLCQSLPDSGEPICHNFVEYRLAFTEIAEETP